MFILDAVIVLKISLKIILFEKKKNNDRTNSSKITITIRLDISLKIIYNINIYNY